MSTVRQSVYFGRRLERIVNIRTVLFWTAGVFLTLFGLILLIGVPPVGIIVVLVGLYILPPINQRVNIDISLSLAAAWITGILLLLFGLVVFQRIPIAGVPALLGGLFALPPVRSQLIGRTGIQIPRGIVAGLVILALVSAVGTTILASSTDETLGHSTEVHNVGERFVVEADNTEMAVTVKTVNRTDSLYQSGKDVPPDEAYIVLTLQIENIGEEHLNFHSWTFKAVSEDDEQSYEMDEKTNTISGAGAYRAPGLDLSPTTTGPRLDAGGNISRTAIFQVEQNRTYLLTVPATGPYSGADRHYVVLGDM